jgi:hypothetical protein
VENSLRARGEPICVHFVSGGGPVLNELFGTNFYFVAIKDVAHFVAKKIEFLLTSTK